MSGEKVTGPGVDHVSPQAFDLIKENRKLTTRIKYLEKKLSENELLTNNNNKKNSNESNKDHHQDDVRPILPIPSTSPKSYVQVTPFVENHSRSNDGSDDAMMFNNRQPSQHRLSSRNSIILHRQSVTTPDDKVILKMIASKRSRSGGLTIIPRRRNLHELQVYIHMICITYAYLFNTDV